MKIVARRTKKLWLLQRFYYVLIHPNGETLMHSEMRLHRSETVETAKHIAKDAGFEFIDETQ